MALSDMTISAFDAIPELPSIFGKAKQVAYVVADIDQAIEYWHQTFGVGPFLVARNEVPLRNAIYRGNKTQDVTVNIAFSYVNDCQLELVQMVGNTPSLYQEALDCKVSGVHHYAVVVEDFASAYQYALNHGYEAVVDSGIDGLARMSYLENKNQDLIIELIEWNALTEPYFVEIEKRWIAADPNQAVHDLKLSELLPIVPMIGQLGKFIVKKLSGQVVKTMPS